jgi:N-acetylglucosamine-6-sulfatase
MTDDLDNASMEQLGGLQQVMGSEGITFENAYVNYALCCPSRDTFFRGQYPHNHGILTNEWPEGGEATFRKLGLDRSTITTWLDRAGYRTKYIGRYLNEYSDLYVPPGWDEWFVRSSGMINYDGQYVPLTGHPTDVFAQETTDFIRRSSASPEPFFV